MNRRMLIAGAFAAGCCEFNKASAQTIVPFPIGPGAPGLPVPPSLYRIPNKFPLPSGYFVAVMAKILCEDKVSFSISIDQLSKDGTSRLQGISVDYNSPNDTGVARGALFAGINDPTWITYSCPRNIADRHFSINTKEPEIYEFTAISVGGEEWYHMKMSKDQNKLNGPLVYYPPTAWKSDIAGVLSLGQLSGPRQ